MQNTHLNPLPYRQHTLSVHYEPLENFHHTTSRQDYTAPPLNLIIIGTSGRKKSVVRINQQYSCLSLCFNSIFLLFKKKFPYMACCESKKQILQSHSYTYLL